MKFRIYTVSTFLFVFLLAFVAWAVFDVPEQVKADHAISAVFFCNSGAPAVQLEWHEIPDAQEYNIFRGGGLIATLDHPQTFYIDTDVEYDSNYQYIVNADGQAAALGVFVDTGIGCVWVNDFTGPSNPFVGDTETYTAEFIWSSVPEYEDGQYRIRVDDPNGNLAGGDDGIIGGGPGTSPSTRSITVSFSMEGTYRACAWLALHPHTTRDDGSVTSHERCMNINVGSPVGVELYMDGQKELSAVLGWKSEAQWDIAGSYGDCRADMDEVLDPAGNPISVGWGGEKISEEGTHVEPEAAHFKQSWDYVLHIECTPSPLGFNPLIKTARADHDLGHSSVNVSVNGTTELAVRAYDAVGEITADVSMVSFDGSGFNTNIEGLPPQTPYTIIADGGYMEVLLEAAETAHNGKTFSFWEGCDGSPDRECNIRVEAGIKRQVRAIYGDGDPPPPPPPGESVLNVRAELNGVNPGVSIDVYAEFPDGTWQSWQQSTNFQSVFQTSASYALTAPNPDGSFEQWLGCDQAVGTQCWVDVGGGQERTVTAIYDEPDPFARVYVQATGFAPNTGMEERETCDGQQIDYGDGFFSDGCGVEVSQQAGTPSGLGGFTEYVRGAFQQDIDARLRAENLTFEFSDFTPPLQYVFDRWEGCDSTQGTQGQDCNIFVPWGSATFLTVHYKEAQGPTASNLSVTAGNMCVAPLQPRFSWTFQGVGPQTAYQLQVGPAGQGYNIYGTGKISSDSNEHTIPSGTLTFNTSYQWRLKVWDANDLESEWVLGPNFTTQEHAAPNVDFSWSPTDPAVSETVQFIDQTTTSGGATKESWSWTFQDATPSTASVQNPQTSFDSAGNKQVTLQVTDSSGLQCSNSKIIEVLIQIPEFREVIE